MKYLIALALILGVRALHAQDLIFPDLDGQALIDALQTDYRPDTVLDYGDARDTLYSRIDIEGDTVYGVYSRFGKYLPPGVDPTQALFGDGGAGAINTEHTWPRSKGAAQGTLGYSDMHHLFATRADVNARRATDPFGEIDDSQTDEWYYLDQTLTSRPAMDIDEYSEYISGRFEPREDHKGNVARAMFYFYTVYRDEVDASDPGYFEIQREDLCAWHFMDPANESDLLRSARIASYQGGTENPFVLDCTLAWRTYCPEYENECVTSNSEVADRDRDWRVYLNAEGALTITGLKRGMQYQIILTDMSGRVMDRLINYEHITDAHLDLNWTNYLARGAYVVYVVDATGRRFARRIVKF